MQVYKLFFRIVNKQKGLIVMYLCIFMGIGLAISSQQGATTDRKFEASSYSFAVFDEDDSAVSRALIQYLGKNNERVFIRDDRESIQDELYNQNVSSVLRIPKGFAKSLQDGGTVEKIVIVSVPGTIYKETFESLTSQYITLLKGYIAGGFTENEAIRKAGNMDDSEVSVLVEDAGSEKHSPLYNFFVYAPYILLSLCIVGITPVLVIFHKKEVKDRVWCSSYNTRKINRELILGTVTAGVLFAVVYIICSVIGAGNDVFSVRGLLACLNLSAFLFVALGIVFLLGQTLKKTTVISMASNVLSLGMCFLSGVFVPLEYMGDGIVRLAHLLPSYWYVLGVRFLDHYKAGMDLSPLWKYAGIQILFAIVIMGAGLACSGIRNFKVTLPKENNHE